MHTTQTHLLHSLRIATTPPSLVLRLTSAMIASPGFTPPTFAADRLMAAAGTNGGRAERIAWPPARRRANWVRVRRGGARAAAGGDGRESKMDYWDRMELKFGRLLGKDPKLTLAKKSFRKGKGKTKNGTVRLSSNGVEESDTSSLDTFQGSVKSSPGDGRLNLSRPPMKKGSKIKANSDSILVEGKRKLLDGVDEKNDAFNMTLRKPSSVVVDDIQMEKTSELKIQPNLYLKMRNEKKEPLDDISDITLLKKPQPLDISLEPNQGDLSADKFTFSESSELDNELKSAEQRNALSPELGGPSSVQASLRGKPQRFDTPTTETYNQDEAQDGKANDEDHTDILEIKDFRSTVLDEGEVDDWVKAEELFRTGEQGEVELISCSNRGFFALFGSLLGFLPYRNLGARWKFLAFESWLRKKGLDPSLYKQNFGIVGSVEVQSKDIPPSSSLVLETAKGEKDSGKQTKNIKLEDLLHAYDQEKTRFLSSFIGQRLKVTVVLANRKSRKLMFSGRPREREEIIEKKRSLMVKLSVGDVVKCSIKKITYFGIFVEVEGVHALIHQSEVSWDASLDPAAYYKIGQIVEAKVHQLDFALERITLSLKEIVPDPLIEALESVVGDHSLEGNLQAALADAEWPDVETLIKELQQMQGINSVSKGRFFVSPGLAPSFQVYVGSTFENKYKLLARAGNKVQEVIVQASLDKEQMKAAILTCTNRVE